jgi:CheY-like chemotaxis protein
MERVQRAADALADGSIAKMLETHDREEAKAWLTEKRMLALETENGDLFCADCAMPVEKLAGPEGVMDKLEATRAVTSDMSKYIKRTREVGR